MLSTKRIVELNMLCPSQAYTRPYAHEQMFCCHANKKLFKLLMNLKMKIIPFTHVKKLSFSVQLQQIVAAKRRIRAEARTLTSSRWKWKDGKMAIHTTMRRIIDRNQETTKWGEYANNNADKRLFRARLISQAITCFYVKFHSLNGFVLSLSLCCFVPFGL